MTQKILYIDMDNVLVDFRSGIARLTDEQRAAYADNLDEVPGLFALMDPMPGAIEAFARLRASSAFETFILSTAPWENPSAWSDKAQWVQKYLGEVARKRLILSHRKDLCRGDFLVDDRTKNGAGEFEGELVQFGSERFPDWDVVVAYLEAAVAPVPSGE